jgi:hypothetical protein
LSRFRGQLKSPRARGCQGIGTGTALSSDRTQFRTTQHNHASLWVARRRASPTLQQHNCPQPPTTFCGNQATKPEGKFAHRTVSAESAAILRAVYAQTPHSCPIVYPPLHLSSGCVMKSSGSVHTYERTPSGLPITKAGQHQPAERLHRFAGQHLRDERAPYACTGRAQLRARPSIGHP